MTFQFQSEFQNCSRSLKSNLQIKNFFQVFNQCGNLELNYQQWLRTVSVSFYQGFFSFRVKMKFTILTACRIRESFFFLHVRKKMQHQKVMTFTKTNFDHFTLHYDFQSKKHRQQLNFLYNQHAQSTCHIRLTWLMRSYLHNMLV